MRIDLRKIQLVILPLIVATVVLTLALPAWLGMLIVTLSVVVPALFFLQRADTTLRRQATDCLKSNEHSLQMGRAESQESLAFVQRVMDLIPYPVLVKDADGYCILSNQAMIKESHTRAELQYDETSQTAAEDCAVILGNRVLREARDVDPQSGLARVRIINKDTCMDARGEPVVVEVHVDLTELRQAECRLQETLSAEVALRERTQAFIQSLIDDIPDPVFIKKACGRYEMINEAFAQYRNVDKLTFKGFKVDVAPISPEHQQATVSEDDQVLAGRDIEKEDHTFRQATGEEVFRIISKRRSIFFDGDPVVVGVERHISKWRIAERELNAVLDREMAQRLRTERFVQDLIDVIPDPVYVKNADGQYIIINDAFARLRQQSRDELLGLTAHDLNASEEGTVTSQEEDALVIAGETIHKEQHTHLQTTGEEVFRIVSKRRCVSVEGSPVVVGIDHYITEWRLAERELKRMAEEDVLTGISNRRHFNVEARRALEQALRHGEALSLLMFDLDHFKNINDQYGHNIGDEVLREMSKRMQENFRKSDLPGRWGGEEFIALLPHTTLDAALTVAERLRARLADKPITTSAGNIQVTLSGGAAQLRAEDCLETLIARADTALYAAKHDGRNRIKFAQNDSANPAADMHESDNLAVTE